jgi:hypothetical protein
MKLLPEVVSALQALQQEYIWIVILRVGVVTAQLLPVFDKMAEQSEVKLNCESYFEMKMKS